MLGAFERLGSALCDRAMEHDWKSAPPVAVNQRLIFAFDGGGVELTTAGFAEQLDVLHRTFLGYPAKLAPTDRVRPIPPPLRRHAGPPRGGERPGKRLSPEETGWVTVCEGLIRHPEFHFY